MKELERRYSKSLDSAVYTVPMDNGSQSRALQVSQLTSAPPPKSGSLTHQVYSLTEEGLQLLIPQYVSITYLSKMEPDFATYEIVNGIVDDAAKHNKTKNIGGFMEVDQNFNWIKQTLYGDGKEVLALFNRIRRDHRHKVGDFRVEEVFVKPKNQEAWLKAAGGWGMKWRGGVPRKPQGSPDDEEEVASFVQEFHREEKKHVQSERAKQLAILILNNGDLLGSMR